MSKISSEFILGSAIGYFFSNNLLVFTLGLATGVVIQEKFGSVYKFSEFCYDSTKEIIKQKISKLTFRWWRVNNNTVPSNNTLNVFLDEQHNSNVDNDDDEPLDDEPLDQDNKINLNGNSLKNKVD